MAWPAIDIYTHATELRCLERHSHAEHMYTHGRTRRGARIGRVGKYTRAKRPAHTVSPVYISEVPWPPPSVTTSYIPLCPPTPPLPPDRLYLFPLLLLLLLLLPPSAQAFLICIPLRWHSSPPLDSPSVVSFASSSPPTTPSTQQPRCPSCEVSRTRVCPSSVYHAYTTRQRGGRSVGGDRGEEETKRLPLTSAHRVRRLRDTK